MNLNQSPDKIARERQYHDLRFATEGPRQQAKYYYAVQKMETDFTAAIGNLVTDADVLEYGCGDRTVLHDLALKAHTVTGIDISDVAVGKSLALAKSRSLDNASFLTMNAEAMTFPDAHFDLIFGSGIIHHLDIARSVRELHRVLRPGGTALFLEPLGHNPVINFYRRLTPEARTQDEHPLLRQDFRYFSNVFGEVETRHYGLLSLASLPFRKMPGGASVRDALTAADDLLFRLGSCRWLSWFALIVLHK